MRLNLLFKASSITQVTKDPQQSFPCPGKNPAPGVGTGLVGLYETSCDDSIEGFFHYSRFNTFTRRMSAKESTCEASSSSSHRRCRESKVFGLGTMNMVVYTRCKKKIDIYLSYTIRLRPVGDDFCVDKLSAKITAMTVNGKPATGNIKFKPLGGGAQYEVALYVDGYHK